MELVNQTPVVAQVQAGHYPGQEARAGLITAKATFRVEPDGTVVLDGQEPEALFHKDEETELGLIPRDDLVRRDGTFEVVLLGAAHAPGGRPTRATRVALTVGEVRRELLVFGDRRWRNGRGAAAVTDPEPFTRMPLTWDRAFGGTAPVLIDRDSFVDVSHPVNPDGRGFDPRPMAEGLAKALEAPRGYPVLPEERMLPNLEDPRRPVRGPADDPFPTCWATTALHSGVQVATAIEQAGGQDAVRRGVQLDQVAMVLRRAHPDWVLPEPPRAASVVLEGATPEGRWSFRLSMLRVTADYVVGSRSGQLELLPQRLVLLPEERRFTLSFGQRFQYQPEEGERCMRLRIDHEGETA